MLISVLGNSRVYIIRDVKVYERTLKVCAGYLKILFGFQTDISNYNRCLYRNIKQVFCIYKMVWENTKSYTVWKPSSIERQYRNCWGQLRVVSMRSDLIK